MQIADSDCWQRICIHGWFVLVATRNRMSIAARIYVYAVISIGACVTLSELIRWESQDLLRFVCYMGLAMMASRLKVARRAYLEIRAFPIFSFSFAVCGSSFFARGSAFCCTRFFDQRSARVLSLCRTVAASCSATAAYPSTRHETLDFLAI